MRWFLSLLPNLFSIIYGRCLFGDYKVFSVVRIQRQRDVDRSQVVDPFHLYPKGEPASGSLPKYICPNLAASFMCKERGYYQPLLASVDFLCICGFTVLRNPKRETKLSALL